MPLSNSQYEQLMRSYEQKQLDNHNRLNRRYEEVICRIPRLREIDDAIASLSVSQARSLLDGEPQALSSLKEKVRSLSLQKLELLKKNGYPGDYLELHYTCLDCKDTGFIGTEKCHCFKKAEVDLLYTRSNLQDILEEENFNTFSLDYYSKNHIDKLTGRSSRDSVETALRACHVFVDTFSSDFRNILLYGDTGVGKTFLSHCIARELIEASFSVIYMTAAHLFDTLAQSTFGRRDSQYPDAFEHIYSCDLLIIDDLGTELSNSFTTSQLFITINERILRKKSTIISTNLALEDMKAIYSERTFSRLSSNYTMLRLTGDDIRIQKKLLNLGGTKNATP